MSGQEKLRQVGLFPVIGSQQAGVEAGTREVALQIGQNTVPHPGIDVRTLEQAEARIDADGMEQATPVDILVQTGECDLYEPVTDFSMAAAPLT